MAAATTIILGILGGGALVGGALVAIDPLKARQPSGPQADADVANWSDGTLVSVDAANAALQMLGYGGVQKIEHFQSDMNELRDWHRALAQGEERVPPPEAGFVHVPPALHQIEAGPDLSRTNELDRRTVAALAEAVRAAVYATGKSCMTDAGEVVEADATDCLNAWQQAFRYAYEANQSGPAPSAGFQAVAEQTDEWGRPVEDEMVENGTYGPYLWRTYKDNSGSFQGQWYYTTWRTQVGYEAPAGPFASPEQAKHAVLSYIANQLGEPPPENGGPGFTLHAVPVNGNGNGNGLGLGG